MAQIDVGSAAINRDSSAAAGTTFFDFANPANESGTLVTLEIWARTVMSGLKVGLFYQVSGNIYKCRSVANIGTVTPAGSKQTFVVNMAIVAGDYIGFYHTGGTLEYGTGGVGRGYLAGDHVNVDEQNTFGVAMGSGSFSLYGLGPVIGPPIVSSTRATASYNAVSAVANLTDKGGYTITKRGVAYNTTGGDPDPTVDDKVEETGDFPTGEFTEGIPNLLSNTLYYVRPYAYSVEEGYGYGTTLTVTTSPSAIVIATLNSRFFGYPANVTFGDMRGGAWVHVYAPADTNPDNLCGADDTQTASPWLFRTFFYFDLRGVPARFNGVNLKVWSYAIGAGFEELHVIEGVQDFEVPTVANWISQNSIATKLGGKLKADITTGGYVSVPLNNAGIAFVKGKLGGYCKLCLMTKDDFENNYSVVVHDGQWYVYLPHESGKEPYLEFVWDPNFENLADPLVKSNLI